MRRPDRNPSYYTLATNDPSGIDMTRDIEDRLRMFGSRAKVQRLALNMDQVQQYDPWACLRKRAEIG